jgi:hypothetical protein
MPGADDPGGRRLDPDDWFASAGSTPPVRPRRREPDGTPPAPPAEPAWFEDEPAGETGLLPAGSLQRRRLALLGGVALVVIVLIVLAVSGVFSSSNSDNGASPPVTTPATTSQTPPAQQTPTTTVKTPARPQIPALTSGLLRQGTSGPEVKAIQQALAAAGHSPGTIDGVFGAQTVQALAAFQQSVGLPGDGVWGPKTKAALEKKLGRG